MKRQQVMMDGNEAVAYTAYRLNEVVAIYPITPSSPWESTRMPGQLKGFPTFGALSRWSWKCKLKAVQPAQCMAR